MKSIVEYMKARRGYYKVENSIIDLSKLDRRTLEIMKGLMGRLVMEGESRKVENEIRSIAEELSRLSPDVREVLVLPKACVDWSGPVAQIKVLKYNSKRG